LPTAPAPQVPDLTVFRQDFPSLVRTVDGRLPAFLDNPAGTQVPRDVIDGVRDYFLTANANLGGAFHTSRASAALFDAAHQAMADLLGAASAAEIVFGQNMTTLTFAISRAIGRILREGDEIIVTNLDHDANIAPWRALTERGVVIRVADIHPGDCTLDMDSLAAQITPRTRLVAVTHCSNLLGSIVDARAVCRLAREAGALSFIDAVQFAAHGAIDVQAIDCDFLVCSSYKFFGPHLGILYGKRAQLDALQAYRVRPADDFPPGKFETGTLNFEGCAGLLGTFSYFERIAATATAVSGLTLPESRRVRLLLVLETFRQRESALGRRLIEGLQRIPGVRIWGITDPQRLHERVPTVGFTLDGHHPDAIAARLGEEDIYVWSGNNYALALTERLGIEATGGVVRVGPVHYNTPEELDRLMEVVDDLAHGAVATR
jgi:cysteine desulfurase family protein (TIGR01976 family)